MVVVNIVIVLVIVDCGCLFWVVGGNLCFGVWCKGILDIWVLEVFGNCMGILEIFVF